MRICENCERGIQCDTFMDVKCLVKGRRIINSKNEALRCKDYKKDTREKKTKCQCKHCLSKTDEE